MIIYSYKDWIFVKLYRLYHKNKMLFSRKELNYFKSRS